MKPAHQRIDGRLLAIAQILSPVCIDAMRQFIKDLQPSWFSSLDAAIKRFRELERDGFLWRNSQDQFIVTPKGDKLVRQVLKPNARDEIRLLHLNRRRKGPYRGNGRMGDCHPR